MKQEGAQEIRDESLQDKIQNIISDGIHNCTDQRSNPDETIVSSFDQLKLDITHIAQNVVSTDDHYPVNEAPVQAVHQSRLLDDRTVRTLLHGLFHTRTRPQAILDLCKQMNRIPQCGSLIYLRPAVLAAILLEIVRHYPLDFGQPLNPRVTEVLCAIVALFQRAVLSREVRLPFLSTHSLFYLLPYLKQTAQTRETEQLRVSLLGLFATAASKIPIEVMEHYLLRLPTGKSESTGRFYAICSESLYDHTVAALGTCTSEVGKTMALVLLARLLSSSEQLSQIGSDPHRFHHLISNLNSIITYMARKFERIVSQPGVSSGAAGSETESPTWSLASTSFDRAKRLFRFTMDCMYRLAEDPRMCIALRVCLPLELRSRLFTTIFGSDREVDTWLEQLWYRIKLTPPPVKLTATHSGSVARCSQWPDRETDARI